MFKECNGRAIMSLRSPLAIFPRPQQTYKVSKLLLTTRFLVTCTNEKVASVPKGSRALLSYHEIYFTSPSTHQICLMFFCFSWFGLYRHYHAHKSQPSASQHPRAAQDSRDVCTR